MLREKTKWVPVSRTEPCAICGRSSWCTRSADGNVSKCMWKPNGEAKLDRSGSPYWIYRHSEPLPEVKYEPKPRRQRNLATIAFQCEWGVDSFRQRELLSVEIGVPVFALEKLHVGWSSTNGYSTWPERDHLGKIVGIIRRIGDEKKTLGSHGVYYEDDWFSHGGPVVIPEGGTDTACLVAMEISAIGRFSNTGGSNVIADMLDGTRRSVIVVGENDRKDRCENCEGCQFCWPGLFGARLTVDQLSRRGIESKVAMLSRAKDIREWTKENGFDREKFLSDIESSDTV